MGKGQGHIGAASGRVSNLLAQLAHMDGDSDITVGVVSGTDGVEHDFRGTPVSSGTVAVDLYPLPQLVNIGIDDALACLEGYFGSTMSVSRNHCRTVLRDRLVRLAISRIESFSRICIRLILANMPTVITPGLPAHSLSR